MCGIVGIVRNDAKAIDEVLLARMCAAIRHRGPDEDGFYVNGPDCPKHLRGMFAFAIWDERTQELFLARDRVGKKPLLYAHLNGQLVFGSEFSALLTHPDGSRDVNFEAIHHYL